MVRRLRGGGQGSTFDARTILNVTKRIRGNKLQQQQQRVGGRLPLVSRGRGGLWTKRSLGLGRPTAAAGVKTLTNFTVVAAAPSTPPTFNAAKQQIRIGRLGGAAQLTRTIDNSRVTVSGGGLSKTIVNPKSTRLLSTTALRSPLSRQEGLGLQTMRHPLSRQEDLGLQTVTRRVGNSAASVLTDGRSRQVGVTRTGPSAMFISAMREAQADHTPYEPTDVSMEEDEEDVQSPIRTTSARARLGPPPQQKSAAVRGIRVLITNLASSVTNDDVAELCSSVNGLVESRLIEPGLAEAIYSTRRAAEEAINLYDKRELDGVPMRLQLTEPQAPKVSSPLKKQAEQGTLPALRQKLKTTSAVAKKPEMTVDRDLITSALFPQKKGNDASGVTFTVKI
uniref:RRM domain-containing protein n=1 Tax=Plectus sambesii TaxID=2011161 RepID=A0A914WHK7_9BILA